MKWNEHEHRMNKVFNSILAFLITIGSQASATDPVDLQKLKDTNECVVVEVM